MSGRGTDIARRRFKPSRRSWSLVSLLACLTLIQILLFGLAPNAQAVNSNVTGIDCGYDAATKSFLPVAAVHRASTSTGELSASVQLALFDGSTQLATLGTGQQGSGTNGTVDVAVGQTVYFRPEAAVKFGDPGYGGPLTPDHQYQVRTRMTDFDDLQVEIKFWDCQSAASAACSDRTDNDGDGKADYPADLGCDAASDDDENCHGLATIPPGGQRPAWRSTSGLTRFPPNTQAACNGVWVPGIDERFVPQGLALTGTGTALVSGYVDVDGDFDTTSDDRCRIISVNLSSGVRNHVRTFPISGVPDCHHGGGISSHDGKIWLVDTPNLYVFDPARVWDTTKKPGVIELENLRGSFVTEGRSGRLYIGHNDPHGADKLFQFETSTLQDRVGGKLRPGDRIGDPVTLPDNPQGADSQPGGGRWVSSSTGTSKPSWCAQLKKGSSTYSFGAGSEEIDFASNGSLWSVFEAGAKTFGTQGPFFPVIARFDTNELVSGSGCGF